MAKIDKTVEVSSTAYDNAKNNWDAFWAQQMAGQPYQSFHNYLGMHSPPYRKTRFGKEHIVKIRESAARKIQMLTGPHWFTMLKASLARHAEDT